MVSEQLFGRARSQRSGVIRGDHHFLATSEGSSGVVGQVVGDAEQPGREFCRWAIRFPGTVDPQEHLLCEILGRVLSSNEVRENVDQPIAIGFYQLSKRRLVTILNTEHALHVRIVEEFELVATADHDQSSAATCGD